MKIDLFHERVLSLNEAAAHFPRHRRGRKVHPSTLYRYARWGIRNVRLDTVRVGGTLCTSKEAIQRFCDELTRLDRDSQPGSLGAINQQEVRRGNHSIGDVDTELDREGLST